MGSLKPGATYIYEKAGAVTYCREMGADPSTRVAIGWDYDGQEKYFNSKFWDDILKEAESNPTLQKAIDRVIMLYKLSKEKLE